VTRSFVFDASVLVDYFEADLGATLRLVSAHGRSLVPETTVLELERGSKGERRRRQIKDAKLDICLPTFKQLSEGGRRVPGLSFEDHVCLIVARDLPGVCVANDGPLRTQCMAAHVETLRGLRLLLILFEQGLLSHAETARAGQRLAIAGRYRQRVLDDFAAEMERSIGK